jgi:AcrR family transcriptional regulator
LVKRELVTDGRTAKGDATRSLIIEKATTAFVDAGYHATSIEDVLAIAGVSRGALYHHFAGKDELFVAVLETVEQRVATTVVQASRRVSDPVKGLQTACAAWLKLAARDPIVKKIVLIEAPSVLGWERWRELDLRFGFGLLKAALEEMARSGLIQKQSVDMFAHILLAAVIEVALLVARADNQGAVLRTGTKAIHELIERLMSGGGSQRS